MGNSIRHSETIYNMLKKINLTEKLSKLYNISHIMTVITIIFSVGYRGFETHSVHHCTTTAHFLNKGKWDETIVENILKEEVRTPIYKEAQCTGKPMYLIIDDTISSKTKPSSKAKYPIEDIYFHFSHLKKKSDYGHQTTAVMLSCNGITLNYAIIRGLLITLNKIISHFCNYFKNVLIFSRFYVALRFL